jgi:hypothetical protein
MPQTMVVSPGASQIPALDGSMRQFHVDDDLVFQKSRGVENGLFDIFGGEIRPTADDVVTGRTAGDEFQDELDSDPCTANAWFPAGHGWVRYDALEHEKLLW